MMDFRRVDVSKQKAYDLLRDWIKLVARHTNPDQDISELLGWLWKLKPATPDPDTGLLPCGWCGPERIGWFSVQFWLRASTGKRKWMSVTQKYKKQVNYCPMCGRKLEDEK